MAKTTLRPNYQRIEGILFPPFLAENIREILNYKPKPADLFIATYPKCGSTWMQNISFYISRNGQELRDYKDVQAYCSFIDADGIKGIENTPRPGALKTHLPFTHMPYSPDAKYIYVLRNPKDCCVSLYYHTVRSHHKVYAEATFEDFFEIFMTGEVEYNDYFDHLMSWYPHRNDKNVFFTTYEDMKTDSKNVVLKVAHFMGQEHVEAIEKDNNVLNNILRFSGFDYMKEHFKHRRIPGDRNDFTKTENSQQLDQLSKKQLPHFIRKGIVGDWKNHFSAEQNERMNKKFIERTEGTEIYDMYKPYMFT